MFFLLSVIAGGCLTILFAQDRIETTTPITRSATSWRVGKFLMEVDIERIYIQLRSNAPGCPAFGVQILTEDGICMIDQTYTGATAITLMGQVNTGNFTTTTLQQNILARVQKDRPELAGLITP